MCAKLVINLHKSGRDGTVTPQMMFVYECRIKISFAEVTPAPNRSRSSSVLITIWGGWTAGTKFQIDIAISPGSNAVS